MKIESETYPLYVKETRPILIGDGMNRGIRFHLEQKNFTKKKNEGELPFPVKEVRCLELTSGEIDVPEEQVILWLQSWVESQTQKKAKR